MHQITVLIADDHALFREGLVMLLSQQGDIQVVGEAGNATEVLNLAEALQPDILLLDIRMPDVSGLDVLPKIRAICPRTKVMILSGYSDVEVVVEALQKGAKGYLSKEITHKELTKAIRATYNGEIWAGRKLLTQVLESLFEKISDLQVPQAEMRDNLTDREQEVVKWVVQGRTNKEIGAELGISEKTVKTHLSNIFSKLKVGRRLQLLLYRITDHMD